MDRTVKIWICIFLAIALCIAIGACAILSRSQQTPTPTEETTTAPTTTAPTTVPEETTMPEPTTEETTTAPETTQPEETEHPHVYTEEVVAPSCTEKGYTEYTCDCGYSYTGGEKAALGHKYNAVKNEEEHYTEYTCTRCDASYKEYSFPSTGDTAFFDDAAFIGDSVTLKLRNYHMKTGALGKTTFLCIGSYGVNNAVTNQLYLSYQGKDMTPQDALAACGAKKVFILLGMNDIALFGENSIDIAMDNWAKLLKNIREKNPDIQIFIQSGTPIYTDGQKGGLNNERMDKYNVALKKFAAENDCDYIDIATPMKDSTNGLKTEYCSDAYVHFTDAACKLWIEILKNYVNG